MKSILITFDQAHYERVISILDKNNSRGFTYLDRVQGRGTKTGEPHYGSHAWPSMCSAVIAIVEDHRVKPILEELREIDEATPMLGLRAFSWNIEDSI